MENTIMHRRDFSDIDVINVAYLSYEPYGELPDFSAFTMGSEHTIVLRNKKTRRLERIDFMINGGNPTDDGKGWRNVWGEIQADDMDKNYCCLAFEFWNGELYSIHASFCGRSRSSETDRKIMRHIRCAAESTQYDPFYESYPVD